MKLPTQSKPIARQQSQTRNEATGIVPSDCCGPGKCCAGPCLFGYCGGILRTQHRPVLTTRRRIRDSMRTGGA